MSEKVYLVFSSYDDGMRYESMGYVDQFENVVFKNESDARKYIEDMVLGAYYEACGIADGSMAETDAFGCDDGYDYLGFDVLEDKGNCIHYLDNNDSYSGNYWIEYKAFEIT